MKDDEKARELLLRFNEMYANPATGEYYIDGDEAQLAYDMATEIRRSLG